MKTAIIIGAGISGLQTARALLKRGIRPVLLEQGSKPGGVWRNAPAESELQVPYSCWAFAEHPWPRGTPDGERPSAKAVQQYVYSYAERFELLPHIMFGCKVKRVTMTGVGGYMVTFVHSQNGSMDLGVMLSDYLVVCIGLHSTPYVPAYRDNTSFQGRQLHAAAFSNPAIVEGKRVVVIGAGRSALESAAMAALPGRAATVTCVFRQMYWPTPRSLWNGTSLEQLLLSRAPLHMLPPYYTASGFCKLLSRLAGPVRASFWARLERQLMQQFGLAAAGRTMMPPAALQTDLLHSSQAVGASWHALVDSGALHRVHNKWQQRRLGRRSGLLGGWWAKPDRSGLGGAPAKHSSGQGAASASMRNTPKLGRLSIVSMGGAGNSKQLNLLGGFMGSRRSTQTGLSPRLSVLGAVGATKTRRGSLLMNETRGSLGGSVQQQPPESTDDSYLSSRYPRAAAAAAAAASARSRVSFESPTVPPSPRRKPPTRQGSYRPDSLAGPHPEGWEMRGAGVFLEAMSVPSSPRGHGSSFSQHRSSTGADRAVGGDSRSRGQLMVERSAASCPPDSRGMEQLTNLQGWSRRGEEMSRAMQQQLGSRGRRRSMGDPAAAAAAAAAGGMATSAVSAARSGAREDHLGVEGDAASSSPILLQLPRTFGSGRNLAGQVPEAASSCDSGQPSPRLRGSLEAPMSHTTAGTGVRTSSTSSRRASQGMITQSNGLRGVVSARGSIPGSIVMQSMTRMNSDISGERSMTPTNSSLPDGSKGLLSWLRRKLSSGGGHPEDEEGDGEDGQPQLLLPGGIHPIRGDVARFTSKSVVLTSGQQLPADMVLYCTGYTKQYNWLDGAITDLLGMQKDGLYLYRSVLPPRLTSLAFVGSEVATYNSMLTAGLQAEWLAAVWAGQVTLPTMSAMQKDVRKQIRWRRKHIPVHRTRAASVQLYMAEYHNQLLTDMGLAAVGRNLVQLTTPLTPAHYHAAFEQHAAASKAAMQQRRSAQLQQQEGGTSQGLEQLEEQQQQQQQQQQQRREGIHRHLHSPAADEQRMPKNSQTAMMQSRSFDNAVTAATAAEAANYRLALHSQLYALPEPSESTTSPVVAGTAAAGHVLPVSGLDSQASGTQSGPTAAGACWVGLTPAVAAQQPARKQGVVRVGQQQPGGSDGAGALAASEDSLVQAQQRVEWWLSNHHDAGA